ncbi:MAG: hypothetical protein ACR2QM_18970 [Longimicrobiales bacterium]
MHIGEPGGFLDWLTEALDSVVRLGRGYQQSHTGHGAEDLFESVVPVVGQLIDHEGVAFLNVAPGGVEFDLAYVTRGLDPNELGDSLGRLVEDGTFAWALYQTGPVIVPSARPRQWLLLHVLATPGRVHGMFVAVLAQPTSFVPDVCQKLLSVVLGSAAGVLESDSSLQRPEFAESSNQPESRRRPEGLGFFALSKRGQVLLVDLDEAEERALVQKLHRLRCDVSVSRGESDDRVRTAARDVDLVFLGVDESHGHTDSAAAPQARNPASPRNPSVAGLAPCVALLDPSPEPVWETLPTDVDGVLTRPVRLEALEAMLDRWVPVTAEDGTAVRETAPPVGAGDPEAR